MTAALAASPCIASMPPGMSSRCMASRIARMSCACIRTITRHLRGIRAVRCATDAPQRVAAHRRTAVVLSGVFALMQCQYAWRARAFARYAALHSAQPSTVQASCLERARACGPWPRCRGAGCSRSSIPQPPRPGAPAGGQRRKARQRTRHRARVESQSARGVAQRSAASPPCRLVAQARANADMARVLRTTGHVAACPRGQP